MFLYGDAGALCVRVCVCVCVCVCVMGVLAKGGKQAEGSRLHIPVWVLNFDLY